MKEPVQVIIFRIVVFLPEIRRMKYNHVIPVQVRFNDVDIAGHVNNAVYLKYFDLAKVDYFSKTIGSLVNWKENGVVLAGIKVNFYRPVFLGDKIFIRTRVAKTGGKSFRMIQVIEREDDDEPVAWARSTMVCFDYLKKSSMEIPPEWLQKFEEFENRG